MWKMSPVQLGVLLLALCLTTQVMSQNMTSGNDTMSGNSTTQSPGPFSGATITTTPKSAGAGLRAAVGALFTPVLLALHRLC